MEFEVVVNVLNQCGFNLIRHWTLGWAHLEKVASIDLPRSP